MRASSLLGNRIVVGQPTGRRFVMFGAARPTGCAGSAKRCRTSWLCRDHIPQPTDRCRIDIEGARYIFKRVAVT